MTDQANKQEQRKKQQIAQQNQLNINQTGEQSQQQFGDQGVQVGYSNMGPHGLSNEEAENAPDGYGNQDQFSDVDGQDPYNNLYDEDSVSTSAEEAADDANFGSTPAEEEEEDRDDADLGSTPAEEDAADVNDGLYGLAEPLAKPGDISRQGSNKDTKGTRISQDQQGYQQ